MIKTFEEACVKLNISTELPIVTMIPEKHQKAIQANYKLTVIAEALNDGWKPNWNDWDEYKYFPYFDVKADEARPSGFGLAFHGYDSWHSGTSVGSRLCFQTRELAKYAGEQFSEIYAEAFLIE